mmetsp:Transcript_61/g.194  ORF Transcript_61/g.194 Transcript_61/m.194 type:complete len:368 (-) Transcript_61:81-1184(-)
MPIIQQVYTPSLPPSVQSLSGLIPSSPLFVLRRGFSEVGLLLLGQLPDDEVPVPLLGVVLQPRPLALEELLELRGPGELVAGPCWTEGALLGLVDRLLRQQVRLLGCVLLQDLFLGRGNVRSACFVGVFPDPPPELCDFFVDVLLSVLNEPFAVLNSEEMRYVLWRTHLGHVGLALPECKDFLGASREVPGVVDADEWQRAVQSVLKTLHITVVVWHNSAGSLWPIGCVEEQGVPCVLAANHRRRCGAVSRQAGGGSGLLLLLVIAAGQQDTGLARVDLTFFVGSELFEVVLSFGSVELVQLHPPLALVAATQIPLIRSGVLRAVRWVRQLSALLGVAQHRLPLPRHQLGLAHEVFMFQESVLTDPP